MEQTNLIRYTLIYLCKKKRNIPSTGKSKGRLFFAETTPFKSIQCYIPHTEKELPSTKIKDNAFNCIVQHSISMRGFFNHNLFKNIKNRGK